MPALPVAKPSTFTFSPCEDVSFDVRAILIDGDPWFYAVDVCKALGIDSTQVRKLDDDEITQVIDPDTLHSIQGTGINNLVNVINESGLYTLILRCRDAVKQGTVPHKFRKWVTNEVLPSIRKNGGYQMPQSPAPKAEERITREQLDKIATLVHAIACCCHYKDAASYAVYAGVREQYNIDNIHKLPAIHFESVYGMIHVLYEKAQEYLTLRCNADQQFIKAVLKRHQFQMQMQQNMFFPK